MHNWIFDVEHLGRHTACESLCMTTKPAVAAPCACCIKRTVCFFVCWIRSRRPQCSRLCAQQPVHKPAGAHQVQYRHHQRTRWACQGQHSEGLQHMAH
jgi:hypothetical protein